MYDLAQITNISAGIIEAPAFLAFNGPVFVVLASKRVKYSFRFEYTIRVLFLMERVTKTQQIGFWYLLEKLGALSPSHNDTFCVLNRKIAHNNIHTIYMVKIAALGIP